MITLSQVKYWRESAIKVAKEEAAVSSAARRSQRQLNHSTEFSEWLEVTREMTPKPGDNRKLHVQQ